MSTPRPSEADVNAAESAACPCGHQTLDHAWHGCEQCDCKRSAIHAVLASDWLAARDAEHEREVAALRAERDDANEHAIECERIGVKALEDRILVELERDEARRALADLRGEIKALAEDFEGNVDWSAGRNNYGDNEAWESAARQVRALLPRDDAAGAGGAG